MTVCNAKTTNEKLLQSESPPSLKEDKNTGGTSTANIAGNEINSARSPSPLLDVGVIPSVDSSLCPYCGKQYRKVMKLYIFFPSKDIFKISEIFCCFASSE